MRLQRQQTRRDAWAFDVLNVKFEWGLWEPVGERPDTR